MKKFTPSFLLCALLVLAGFTVQAQTSYVWNGSAGDGSWKNPANWTPNTGYPGDNGVYSDNATINTSGATVTILATNTSLGLNNLTLGNGCRVVISGQFIQLSGNLTVTSGVNYISGAGYELSLGVGNSINLSVAAGASLYIQTELGINENMTITGTAVIDADNGGWLLPVYTTITGNISYQRTGQLNGYSYISSPLSGASAFGLGAAVYSFDNATATTSTSQDNTTNGNPGWHSFSGTLAQGVGYAVKNPGTYTLTGALTASPSMPSFNYYDPANPTGVPFVLVGNPFPSPIALYSYSNYFGVSDFVDDNSGSLATGSIYVWNSPGPPNGTYSTADYLVANAAGTSGNGGGLTYDDIPSGQGFFVELPSSCSGCTIAAQEGEIDQEAATNQYFGAVHPSFPRMWLSAVADSTEYNETLIAFPSDAVDGPNFKYDATKFFGAPDFSVYSISNGKYEAIKGLAPIAAGATKIVPVGIQVGGAARKSVVFQMKYGNNMDSISVLLWDKTSNTYTDLTQTNYTATVDSGNTDARFALVFGKAAVTTGIANMVNEDATLYGTTDGFIVLKQQAQQMQAVKHMGIFNILGQEVENWNNLPAREQSILRMTNTAAGVYIVKASLADGTDLVNKFTLVK